jgi:hypothetical protein
MSHQSFKNPNSDAARQALLDNRCEHKPKNHRTKGRSLRLAKEKRERIKARNALKLAEQREYVAAVRKYWANEADHPLPPS